MRTHRLPKLITIGLVVWPAAVEAQAVRGTLVDRASGLPVEGAFVTLLDETDLEVARVLTSLGGAFLLRAPAPGAYRLRSKRIGFRPSESPVLALADSQIVGYRLEVEAVPVQLPAVIVRGRPQCGAQADAAAVSQLWEEAREALAAVKWTEDQGALRFTVDLFERALPRSGRQVLAQRDSSRTGVGEKPFASYPAEQLAREGYVVARPGDSAEFYGPDAEVLLGDVFLSSHCFGARDGGAEHPGLVGLAFEPEPRRRLPDIAGVLWIDRESLELKFLEFTYTRLRVNTLGGRVEFARLASGPWIVAHWWLRIPRLEAVTRRGLRRPPPRLLGYREAGGTVTRISSPEGAVEYAAPRTTLEGTVVDSSRGGSPLAGAIVSLSGTTRQVLVDEAGRFEIAGPFDGDYAVWFQHPRLDSLGITDDERRVTLSRGVRQTVILSVPPESRVLERLCPDGLGPDQRVIVGVVRDSTLAAVPRAWVAVRMASSQEEQAVRADTAGRFVICEVPAGPLTLSATQRATSGEVILEFRDGGVWVDGKQFDRVNARVWKRDIQLIPRLPEPEPLEAVTAGPPPGPPAPPRWPR